MQFKSLLLASALASTAFAASSTTASSATITSSENVVSSCSFETTTLTASADLSALSSCSAVEGDIVINGTSLTSVSLTGVQYVYGSILIQNDDVLTSFTADSISVVEGSIDIQACTALDTLSFAALATVGSINFVSIPELSTLTLTTGISEINSLIISNTGLEKLDGFQVSSLDTFNLNNNKDLTSITANLETVNTALEVSYNSDDVEVTFDNLVWANNITFRDVGSISMSSLQTVNSTLIFDSNTVTDIELPLLTKIGSSLSISNNDELETMEFKNLTSIGGGFEIANNSALETIDGFDSLTTVGGAIIFIGNFTNASLPSLKKVSGGVTIESSGDLDCDSFNALDKKGSIQGNSYVCKGASTSVSIDATSTVDSSGETDTSDSTASGTSTDGGSEGAAAGSFVVPAGTLLAFVGSFVYALL